MWIKTEDELPETDTVVMTNSIYDLAAQTKQLISEIQEWETR